jgi:hypothetical protein
MKATNIQQPSTRPKRATVCRVTAAARRMVVERGSLGVTNAMLQADCAADSTRVGSVLWRLTSVGELVGALVPGAAKRWFASQELAQRWLATAAPRPKAPPTPRQRIRRREPTAAQTLTVVRQRGASVTIGKRPCRSDEPAIVPAGLQVQRAAAMTHDSRYQCAPGERPAGAGFAAVGIGRDSTTGMAWAAVPGRGAQG